jgi:hypothetical protein
VFNWLWGFILLHATLMSIKNREAVNYISSGVFKKKSVTCRPSFSLFRSEKNKCVEEHKYRREVNKYIRIHKSIRLSEKRPPSLSSFLGNEWWFMHCAPRYFYWLQCNTCVCVCVFRIKYIYTTCIHSHTYYKTKTLFKVIVVRIQNQSTIHKRNYMYGYVSNALY